MQNSDLLYNWPKDAGGKPEKAVLLEVANDFMDSCGILCSMLEGFGIPYVACRPGSGELMAIGFGMSMQGVEIYVPASRAEEAAELLNAPVEFGEEYEEEVL